MAAIQIKDQGIVYKLPEKFINTYLGGMIMRSSAKKRLVHLMNKQKSSVIVLPFESAAVRSVQTAQISESTRRRFKRITFPSVPSSQYLGTTYPLNNVLLSDVKAKSSDDKMSIRDYVKLAEANKA